jgi:hypothetical protein
MFKSVYYRLLIYRDISCPAQVSCSVQYTAAHRLVGRSTFMDTALPAPSSLPRLCQTLAPLHYSDHGHVDDAKSYGKTSRSSVIMMPSLRANWDAQDSAFSALCIPISPNLNPSLTSYGSSQLPPSPLLARPALDVCIIQAC